MTVSAFDRTMVLQVAAALLLLAACGLPARWAEGRCGRMCESLRNEGPNAADYDRIEAGYYQRISTLANRLDRSARSSSAQPFDAGDLALVVPDAREYVLKPSLSVVHHGVVWTTNSRGQRDRERGLSKPAGTFRIAVVGDSIASGWGVEDDRGLTRLLERALGKSGRTVEVLNFAVPGHAPGQRWEHFHRVGWEYAPDLVVFEGTVADLNWDERRIRAFVARGLGFDAFVYGGLLGQVGLSPGEPVALVKDKLKPHRDAVLPWVYRAIVADCRDHGVTPVWLLLPRVGKPTTRTDRERIEQVATTSGFDERIDLSDTFDGLAPSSLAIAADDFHPNADGHALLARRLEQALESASLLPRLQPSEGEPR